MEVVKLLSAYLVKSSLTVGILVGAVAMSCSKHPFFVDQRSSTKRVILSPVVRMEFTENARLEFN